MINLNEQIFHFALEPLASTQWSRAAARSKLDFEGLQERAAWRMLPPPFTTTATQAHTFTRRSVAAAGMYPSV